MLTVLGIYIDSKIVKYAKMQKENENIKILNFNIEFYDNLSKVLRKIIYDTNSQKVPISINLSEEFYMNFQINKNTSKKEIKKSVEAMVQLICDEKKENLKDIEYRFLMNKNIENEENYEILLISSKKEILKEYKLKLNPYKIKSISPIGVSISNLVKVDLKESIAIVNIEEQTKVTCIVDGNIYKINEIKTGIKDIIKAIDISENLYKKNYNIYKNMTIYTKKSKKIEDENNEYLENVLPVLYRIVIEVKKIVDDPFMNISKIYITGSGANINNLDLYFNEYILNVESEILNPFFLEMSSIKTSIKEYLEVTSAMAIALDGLGNLDKNLNFYKKTTTDIKQVDNKEENKVEKEKVKESDIKNKKENENININEENNKEIKDETKEDINEKINQIINTENRNKNIGLTSKEKLMLRICAVFVILIIGFLGISNMSNSILEEREKELSEIKSKFENEISELDKQYEKISKEADAYKQMTENLEALANDSPKINEEIIIGKDAVPNMLESIRKLMPEKVSILSISNEENSKKITIEAMSEKYEQLGYFSSILKTEKILKDVKTSSGIKEGENVKVMIEGELP